MWNTPKNTNHQRSFTLSLNCLNLVRSVQAFYLKFRGMDLNSAEQIFLKAHTSTKLHLSAHLKRMAWEWRSYLRQFFFWLNLSAKTEKNAPKRDLSFSWRLGVDTLNPDDTRWVFCLMALRSTFTACIFFCSTVGGQNPTNRAPGW